MKSQAILLVAGCARRLGGTVKCLTNIRGYGLVFQRTLEVLAPFVDRLVVVVGYQEEMVWTVVSDAARQLGMEPVKVVNACFNETNTAASLQLALASNPSPRTFVVNGDLAFLKVPDLGAMQAKDSSTALMDTSKVADEEVKAIVDRVGWITRIGKNLPPEACLGETVGVYHLNARMQFAFSGAYWSRFTDHERNAAYYEDVLDKCLHAVRFVPVIQPGAVMEFDTPEDIAEIERRLGNG